ncbi:hypothetical protein JOC77_004110 [Peribacillus deserti]|uniref:Uncharacterized protein n=1 Tax=Peribacillus deserti TaxID=673318 RepID=A0ABS2QNP0_9BACI|nr:DUF6338 family protein [Peribacillus deserti]MBM7694635.1 hypothetical protein [Peribacillus deserti]
MEISELAVRLLIIFFPGMLATLLYDTFTRRKKRDYNVFITYSFVIGFLSYFVLYLFIDFLRLLGMPVRQITFLTYLFNSESPIVIREVVLGSVIALVIAFLWSYSFRYKWMQRLAVRFKVSKQFHEKDVWSEILNMEETPWVVIRDYERDRMYQGWIAYYSDTFQENELFLRDVIVYENNSGRKLYEVMGLYLTLDPANLQIEFQSTGGD